MFSFIFNLTSGAETFACNRVFGVERRLLIHPFFSGKLTDAFSSLAKKSNFRALSKRLALVCDFIDRLLLMYL